MDLPAIAGNKPAKTSPFRTEKRYGSDELRELAEALDQGTLFYAHGKKVAQLETEFAALTGFRYAVAASSGTAAIHAALIAAGISPGDEVILPPITDMGSVFPILFQSAIPVFADVDPHTYTLAPASVEPALTAKTRAILAVHLAGNACDMNALRTIADRRSLIIIEDCAQAHGCLYDNQPVGHLGQAACYSFNEFKHISCGDGGLVVTNDEALARRARLATDKAYNRTPVVPTPSSAVASPSPAAADRDPAFLANNYRMTELQGAVARAEIRRLPGIIQRRRQWCTELTARLAALPGLDLPAITPGCQHSWWFYMMRVAPAMLGASADQFAAALAAEGLPARAHYHGKTIYQYPLFVDHSAFTRGTHPFAARAYPNGLCPNAEAILETCIVLPINEAYSRQDLDETVRAITRVVQWFHQRPR